VTTAENSDYEMRPDYDFSEATRGKHASAVTRDAVMVRLDPDVARQFPTAEAVNEALRLLARLKKQLEGVA
jgi:hypothetical protein